jgi:apolipoprotein N-acyltransferase
MNSRTLQIALKILLAVATGIALRQVVGLRPDWWAVWVAPALLLVIALRFPMRHAAWMVPLATTIAASVDFHYFSMVMPLSAVIESTALLSLLWILLAFATRRVVLRYRAWWTVFIYPVLWAATDTLLAALSPDGNWGSLAYSQGDKLAVIQLASIFGTAGVLFLLALVPSAIALAISLGTSLRRSWIAYSITAFLLASSLLYGFIRLRHHVSGNTTTFGILSIDDPIGLRASDAYAEKIFDEYKWRISALADQGAQVVVLPEKIAMLVPAKALDSQHFFSAAARENRVWLEVGIGIDDGRTPTNWSWLFAPDGSLAAVYQKHFMAPPERRDHYATGSSYTVYSINGQRYGLAICKDMHFAALGRAYGQRGASVVLVPAWDFAYLDGWLEERTTAFRGIENGYSIVRASREGLLSASDPYGRVLAETTSNVMPGRSLLVKVTVAPPVHTLYTRIGNLFGWICVIAAPVFLVLGWFPASASPGAKGSAQRSPAPVVLA